MDSDAGYIEAHNQLLAEKYVLTNAIAVPITSICSAIGFGLLQRLGPTGKFPYWAKRRGKFVILERATLCVLLFYGAVFDTWMVSLVADGHSARAQRVYLTFFGPFISAWLISLSGVGIVRFATVFWMRLRRLA